MCFQQGQCHLTTTKRLSVRQTGSSYLTIYLSCLNLLIYKVREVYAKKPPVERNYTHMYQKID